MIANNLLALLDDLSSSDNFIIESEDTLDLSRDENSDLGYNNETEEAEEQEALSNRQEKN